MGITVKIGGVDKTEYVDARTLSIRDELTSKVNSASFNFICNDIAVAPKPGEAVLIEEGTKKLFSGRILSKEESFLPPNLLKYPVECIDHTRDLDKKLVYQMHYQAQKAGDIIKFIILYYTDGFTYNNVSDGPAISDISFDYMQVSDVFTKIAEICGYEWYVDYDKDIHFFAKNTYPAPFELDDDQANYKDLIINTDISQLRNRIYVKSSGLKDTFGEIFIYDGVVTEWTCKFAPIRRALIKLADPNPIPAQEAHKCDFSHNDIYLAVPYEEVIINLGIYIYKRTGDKFQRLNDPEDTPNNDGHDSSFSPDSTYLAVAHTANPFVHIYKRDEDTFTKLTDPAVLPADDAHGCDFSPDGVYLAMAHKNDPFITIYKRAGDVFTKLADPADKPANDAYGCKFSPDGVYLAVAHDTAPWVTIYKRAGDVFTKLANPAITPTGQGNDVTWTPDSIYLAVGHEVSPFITVYKRALDVFTKIDDPAELPAGVCYGVDFSPDGIQLATAHTTSPFVTIYTRSGDILGKQVDPTDLPTGNGKGAIYSHNGKYLAIGHNAKPRLTIYKISNPTIKVDGVTKTIGWDGIDNPLYFDFMLNEATKVLSIGAAGTTLITMGDEAIDRSASYAGHYTNINLNKSANASGKIKLIDIFAGVNMTGVEVSTFFNTGGNNYSTRDTVFIGTVIAGSKQRFSVDLNVVAGDFIGLYWATGELHYNCVGAVGITQKELDFIPCTDETFTPLATYAISIKAMGSLGEGELAIGSEILIGYTALGVPICFKREDQDSIDVVKAIEGGDGIIEFCLVDNNIDSIDWANETAKADLLKNADPTLRATFITNRSDIRSGQIITLISTKRDINQQFIIQKVELVRVDVITEWPTMPYKPANQAEIGYKPASEAEKGYRATEGSGIVYYIFNVTIANKFRKLEDLFIYLLNRTDESIK